MQKATRLDGIWVHISRMSHEARRWRASPIMDSVTCRRVLLGMLDLLSQPTRETVGPAWLSSDKNPVISAFKAFVWFRPLAHKSASGVRSLVQQNRRVSYSPSFTSLQATVFLSLSLHNSAGHFCAMPSEPRASALGRNRSRTRAAKTSASMTLWTEPDSQHTAPFLDPA